MIDLMEKLEQDKFAREAYVEEQAEARGEKKGIKRGMEIGIKQGREQGIKQGIEQGNREIAERMLRANLHIDQIIEISTLSLEEINRIKDSIGIE